MEKCMYLYFLLMCFYFFIGDILAANSCPNVKLPNGRTRTKKGRFVKFICNPSYTLVGDRYSTCIQGKLEAEPPICVRPTCPNRIQALVITNGLIYPSRGGAVLNFYCRSKYKLKGPSITHCDGKKWDNNLPTCLLTDKKPELFCDFEREDFCGWTPDLNHDFDWKREQFKTPSGSIGTGPSYDHTRGAGKDGFYMYIESSSRNINDTARLISPIFEKTNDETCLEFFYHMFGATTGTLRVYLKKTSDSWDLDPSTAIFTKSGNQGNKWFRSFHSLGIINEDYQIIIEGVRGPGYVSDIAIDDVKIIENCNDEEYLYTTTEDYTTDTEIPIAVESCDHRCGQKAFGNETTKTLIACDCDDNCTENNRCCPDYFDLCGTDLTSPDSTSTSYQPDETSPKPMQKPSMETNQKTKILIPATSKILTTTTTTRLKIIKITPQKTTPQRILIIETPPTTPVVVRRILPKTNLPATTEIIPSKPVPKPVKPIKNGTLSKIIYVKPEKKSENDVDNVPRPTKFDEALMLTSALPYGNDASFFEKERHAEDSDDPDTPYFTHLDESNNKLFSQKRPEDDSKLIFFIVGGCAFVVIVVIIAGVFIRRSRFLRRGMNASNGDSQSDVRFLTGDEVLDFSLNGDDDDL